MTDPATMLTITLDLATARLAVQSLGLLERTRGSGTGDYHLCRKGKLAIAEAIREHERRLGLPADDQCDSTVS